MATAQSYVIWDGVRRSVAAYQAGHTSIRAQTMYPNGALGRFSRHGSGSSKGVAMTIETAERDPISHSDRTRPLTPVEMQASLDAMQRLLILLRMMAWGKADYAEIAAFIDHMHNMPEMLLKPGYYDDMFRLSLEAIARINPTCLGILERYDEALKSAGPT
jgi:hypothetical protein